jgi:hypothetical protein
MEFTLESLEKTISEQAFDALIGRSESDWFECKGEPYQLDLEAAKRELAKDVSSFANVKGGYILIGIKTKRGITHFGDEVEKLRPFGQDLLDTSRYLMVIRDWVYPEIEGLDIRWIAIENDSGKGIVVIRIPPQKELSKPFLIKNVVDGTKRIEIQFGLAQRVHDRSQHVSVEDLQRTLRAGLHYETKLSERFDSLEALVKQSGIDSAIPPHALMTDTEVRVQRAQDDCGLGQVRTFVLAAYPSERGELKTVFQTSKGSIRQSLEDPPTLRQGGWSVQTLERAGIIRGELIRVCNENYKVLDLYRDGTLIFAVRADGSFLAWNTPDDQQRLNPVALIESTYNFLRLYELVLSDLKERPLQLNLRVDLHHLHLDSVKSYLLPGRTEDWTYSLGTESHFAPSDDFAKVIEANGEHFDPREVAFRLVKEVYLWFGLEEDKIPYTKMDTDSRKVDPDTIKGL